MWKFFLWCILLTFYVTIVHGQFSKGVIKNNVFFVDDASETNSGAALDLISGLNIGYSRNKLKPTITPPIPTTGNFRSNQPIKKPESLPWSDETTKPIIAYTLPPHMKLRLENAVRLGQLGSRSRSTKKINTATTPEYDTPDLNGVIIKNFIHHLSTTKSDIESTIPNPNQFYTTPPPDNGDVGLEPLVLMNSNPFFPVNQMSVQPDDDGLPMIVQGSINDNNLPIKYQHTMIDPSPLPQHSVPPTTPANKVAISSKISPNQMSVQQDHDGMPLIDQGSINGNNLTVQNQHTLIHPSRLPQHSVPPANPTKKVAILSKISSKPTKVSAKPARLPLIFNEIPVRPGTQPSLIKHPTRRRPISQQKKPQTVKRPIISQQHSNQSATITNPQFPKISSTYQSSNSTNILKTQPSFNPVPSANQNSQYQASQSQNQVILPPTKENSVNVYSGTSSQNVQGLQTATNFINPLNYPTVGQYPTINQVLNQPTSQFANSVSPLQMLTAGQYNQSLPQQPVEPVHPIPMIHDSVVSRPNNSLKQLQLQFLLDCALLDPLTKTKIPLGTNPVGDDFFFTPMPYTNQNPSLTAVNLKQASFNPFNPASYLPSFPSLFPTTPAPITAVVLTDSTTQTTPIYVSIPPSRHHKKKKVKNVYVDLPIVSEVGNMLDKMYNFMEESLVTKVVKKTENNNPPRRSHSNHTQVPQVVQVIPSNQIIPLSAIDGGSDEDYYQRYTTPFYRTTRSRRQRPKRRRPIASTYYTNRLPTNSWHPAIFHRQKRTTLVPGSIKNDRNKNFLTTKIHVTSEYVGPNPTDSSDYLDRRKVTVSSDEDDDNDDDYDDSFSFPEFSFDSGSDDDDDDDDEDNEIQVNKSNLKKNGNKVASSESLETDSYEDGDDDDDDSGEDYTPSVGMFGDFFGNVASSMNKYMPSFSSFSVPSFRNYFRVGSGSKEMDYNSIDREDRSTTPRIETRNPKNPKYIFSDYNDYNGIDGLNGDDSIYNPYLGSADMTTAATDATAASNDYYWNWFGNSNENSASEAPAASQNSSGWFFGLFGSEESTAETTTTTTKRPFLTVDNPLYKPQNWLGILASQVLANKPSNLTEAVPQKVSYDNYQLWRLMPESADQVKFLEDYRITPEGAKLQWWKGPTLRGPTDIVLPPDVVVDVKASLDYEEISHEVVIWDLEKAIKFENPPMSRREKLEMEITQEHPLSWYRYHRYKDIVKFLEYLQRKYPSSVELMHIGRSFEGRPLIVAKVSSPRTNENSNTPTAKDKKKRKANKRSIFIESGTHAREWITPAVATWILDKLVRDLNNTDTTGETVRSVDWYIMPVLNPDGYEYSHQFDRLWRKTRSKHKEEFSLFSNAFNWLRKDKKEQENFCFGTDLNRNWDYYWSEKGSSKSECSEFYAGPSAFSEPETKALSKFLDEQKKIIKLYLSLHSYGQIISYPSRTNASYNSIKSDDLLDMAQVALEALRGSGSTTRYTVDNTNEMMYTRSGSSDFYAMHNLGIKYAYTMELRDNGAHGFLLPPANIDSTAKETFEIIKGMVDYI